MTITSIYYLIFLLTVFGIYWMMPTRNRWLVLLVANIFFYFINAQPQTFIWLLINVCTTYGATLYIAKGGKWKKAVFLITLLLNVGILILLKYLGFITNTLNLFLKDDINSYTFISSLAISFYLLSLLSYLIDIYINEKDVTVQVEKNPAKLLLFSTYFPLMTSGPILRFSKIKNELFEKKIFDYKQVTNGFKRISWGLIKKRGIADVLAGPVDIVFNNYEIYRGGVYLVCSNSL